MWLCKLFDVVFNSQHHIFCLDRWPFNFETHVWNIEGEISQKWITVKRSVIRWLMEQIRCSDPHRRAFCKTVECVWTARQRTKPLIAQQELCHHVSPIEIPSTSENAGHQNSLRAEDQSVCHPWTVALIGWKIPSCQILCPLIDHTCLWEGPSLSLCLHCVRNICRICTSSKFCLPTNIVHCIIHIFVVIILFIPYSLTLWYSGCRN